MPSKVSSCWSHSERLFISVRSFFARWDMCVPVWLLGYRETRRMDGIWNYAELMCHVSQRAPSLTTVWRTRFIWSVYQEGGLFAFFNRWQHVTAASVKRGTGVNNGEQKLLSPIELSVTQLGPSWTEYNTNNKTIVHTQFKSCSRIRMHSRWFSCKLWKLLLFISTLQWPIYIFGISTFDHVDRIRFDDLFGEPVPTFHDSLTEAVTAEHQRRSTWTICPDVA